MANEQERSGSGFELPPGTVIRAEALDDAIELRARELASTAFHAHPAHASDCHVYEEHARHMGRTNTSCPCEKRWHNFLDRAREALVEREAAIFAGQIALHGVARSEDPAWTAQKRRERLARARGALAVLNPSERAEVARSVLDEDATEDD